MLRPLLLTSIALTLGACTVQSEDNGTDAAAAENANMTPEGPSLTAKLFGGGKPLPLDIQRQAQNGTIIYLTSIQAKPTETVIGIKIVNGFEREIELNWSDQKTFIAAQGQRFFLSPPVENKDLSINGGATMDGQLVFLGRLPQVNQLTLVFNDSLSDSQYTSTPGISIPIAITSAAYSDDGSKKNLAA